MSVAWKRGVATFVVVLGFGLALRALAQTLMVTSRPFLDFENIGVMLMIAFFMALGRATRA